MFVHKHIYILRHLKYGIHWSISILAFPDVLYQVRDPVQWLSVAYILTMYKYDRNDEQFIIDAVFAPFGLLSKLKRLKKWVII